MVKRVLCPCVQSRLESPQAVTHPLCYPVNQAQLLCVWDEKCTTYRFEQRFETLLCLKAVESIPVYM